MPSSHLSSPTSPSSLVTTNEHNVSTPQTRVALRKNSVLTDIVGIDIKNWIIRKDMSGKEFTVYPINVTLSNGHQWTIEKRFQEFFSLRNEINLIRTDLVHLSFPSKMWLLNKTPIVLQNRLTKLSQYITDVLNANPRPLELLVFLQVASHASSIQKEGSPLPHETSSLNATEIEQSLLQQHNRTKSFCSLTPKMSIHDFKLLKTLGKGSFGKVYLVKPVNGPTSELYAMKVLLKSNVIDKNQVQHTNQERHIMAKVSHPYLLCLRCAFQTHKKLYMITDYCPGGELFFHFKKMQRFTEGMVRHYSSQIALALCHLHSNNIVYRDLKPENILLDIHGNCKITDYGLSKLNHKCNDFNSTFCGTPEYLSPEMITHRETGCGYGFGIDWWALGIVCYELVCGWVPFYDRDFHLMCKKVLNMHVSFPSKFSVSHDCKDIIKSLLRRDPAKRIICNSNSSGKGSVIDFKTHSFYHPIDWRMMEIGKCSPPFLPSYGRDPTDTCNFDHSFTKIDVSCEEDDDGSGSSSTTDISNDLYFKDFEYIDTAFIFSEVDRDSYITISDEFNGPSAWK